MVVISDALRRLLSRFMPSLRIYHVTRVCNNLPPRVLTTSIPSYIHPLIDNSKLRFIIWKKCPEKTQALRSIVREQLHYFSARENNLSRNSFGFLETTLRSALVNFNQRLKLVDKIICIVKSNISSLKEKKFFNLLLFR